MTFEQSQAIISRGRSVKRTHQEIHEYVRREAYWLEHGEYDKAGLCRTHIKQLMQRLLAFHTN